MQAPGKCYMVCADSMATRCQKWMKEDVCSLGNFHFDQTLLTARSKGITHTVHTIKQFPRYTLFGHPVEYIGWWGEVVLGGPVVKWSGGVRWSGGEVMWSGPVVKCCEVFRWSGDGRDLGSRNITGGEEGLSGATLQLRLYVGLRTYLQPRICVHIRNVATVLRTIIITDTFTTTKIYATLQGGEYIKKYHPFGITDATLAL